MAEADQAKQFLARISGGLEAMSDPVRVAESAVARSRLDEAMRDPMAEAARAAARKVNSRESLSPREQFALEAIIIPDKRPAIDIINGDFQVTHPDWTGFNADPIKSNLRRVIPSVGRVELPHHPTLPFGGTGFVVGDGLLMTNRHVAQIFCGGLGQRDLVFLPGREAGVDFLREKGNTDAQVLKIGEVLMIHPYWDMALLRVEGLGANHPSLSLALTQPDALMSQEVAVIGYPAFDPRNDANVQNTVFGGVYYVKRLQPGRVGPRRTIESFENRVSAMTHDSSTLGGNSGSVVVLAKTGQVVGLHFAGVYLDANFAVPTAELARDGRVVDAGVNFQPVAQPDPAVSQTWWANMPAERASAPPSTVRPSPSRPIEVRSRPPSPPPPSTQARGSELTFTVPLEISVRLGAGAPTSAQHTDEAATTEAMVEPLHDDDYSTRMGYDPGFLGPRVPLPDPKDVSLVAKLDDGDHVIPYHHFSLVLHKRRRLALFTASNLDASGEMRVPEPGRKFTRKALGDLGKSDTEKWFSDPRIPAIHQLPDRFFTKDHGAFDKGHLVRREDVAWGESFDEAQLANGDTFHTTNCSPQVSKFNRPDQKSNWGELEKFVSKGADGGRLSIFAGPVLSEDDKVFVGVDDEGEVRVQIPSQYWKVVVVAEHGKLKSYGFILRQDLGGVPLEFAVTPKWRQHMISIADLEKLLVLVKFPAAVRNADQAGTPQGEAVRASAGVEAMPGQPGRPPAAPQPDPTSRARAASAAGPITFRDHFASLYQSAVDDIAGKVAAEKKANVESLSSDTSEELVLAAQQIVNLQMGGQVSSQPGADATATESMLEGMSVAEHARACASLGWQYMQAKVFGDAASARRLEGELDSGTCDPRWAQTISEYAKYFGVGGSRVEPLYVTPEKAGDGVMVIKKDAKIGLIGDWGTGVEPAQRVLRRLQEQKPDVLIHLGDIYYSGTPEECRIKFEAPVNRIFNRPASKLPVYTLSGNHDMYCGGVGYYELIQRLNKGLKGANGKSLVQPASFFCLRAEDDSWQLLAMDTGRHDYSPFSVTDAVTFVDLAEQEWLVRRMTEFNGKTILLSHHQLFSAFSQIGTNGANGRLTPVNPKLQATYAALTQNNKKIAAWFWGHEHNLCIYEPYAGLERGRCLGHSAIPVFVDDEPYKTLADLANPPRIAANSMLSKDGQFFTHGFATLSLGSDGVAIADYFEDRDGGNRKMYSEKIS